MIKCIFVINSYNKNAHYSRFDRKTKTLIKLLKLKQTLAMTLTTASTTAQQETNNSNSSNSNISSASSSSSSTSSSGSGSGACKKMDLKCAAEENLPTSEMDLLAKLEAANKLIESDAKSLNSLHSTHSRKNSDTSQISLNSSEFNCKFN